MPATPEVWGSTCRTSIDALPFAAKWPVLGNPCVDIEHDGHRCPEVGTAVEVVLLDVAHPLEPIVDGSLDVGHLTSG